MARVCVICSVSFEHRRADAEVCGKECQVKRDTIKRRDSGRLRKANMDAEKYARRRAEAREYFSNQRAQGKDKVTWACVNCGNTFKVKRHSEAGYWCSNGCRADWHTLPKEKTITFYANTCATCGQQYLTAHLPHKYCSAPCRHKTGRVKKWISPETRRAIYERDQWVCHLCGESVSQDLTWSSKKYDPLYPSLDHIVPRSQGGSDDADNLKLAHVICNSLRQDAPVSLPG